MKRAWLEISKCKLLSLSRVRQARVSARLPFGFGLQLERFPGYLSKYLDIKFEDVPNGLSAFSKARLGASERVKSRASAYSRV